MLLKTHPSAHLSDLVAIFLFLDEVFELCVMQVKYPQMKRWLPVLMNDSGHHITSIPLNPYSKQSDRKDNKVYNWKQAPSNSMVPHHQAYVVLCDAILVVSDVFLDALPFFLFCFRADLVYGDPASASAYLPHLHPPALMRVRVHIWRRRGSRSRLDAKKILSLSLSLSFSLWKNGFYLINHPDMRTM